MLLFSAMCLACFFDSRNMFGLFFSYLDRLGFAFSLTYLARFFSSICSSVIRLFLTDNNTQAYCVPTFKIIQKITQLFVFYTFLKQNKFGIVIQKCQFVITQFIFLPFFVMHLPFSSKCFAAFCHKTEVYCGLNPISPLSTKISGLARVEWNKSYRITKACLKKNTR